LPTREGIAQRIVFLHYLGLDRSKACTYQWNAHSTTSLQDPRSTCFNTFTFNGAKSHFQITIIFHAGQIDPLTPTVSFSTNFSLTSAYKFPMHTGIPATHTAPIESLCDGQCDQISQSSQLSFGNSTSSITQPLDVSKVRELLPELFPLCSRCTFSFWTYISCPLQLNQLSEIHKIGPTTLFGPKPL
jgi:hypothetical protein